MLTLSVVNTHASLPVEAELRFDGGNLGDVSATVLSADDITAHNTFDDPSVVEPQEKQWDAARQWAHVFPPASVTVIRARVAS